MAEIIATKDDLIRAAFEHFRKIFKDVLPTHAASAPGRVNLIGEHTDYNNGYVFPMGLPMYTVVVGKANQSSDINIHSMSEGLHEPNHATFKIPRKGNLSPGPPKWANYCKGVIANFKGEVPGFDAVVITSVPIGGGVSSSASLEVATYTFLEALTGAISDLTEKALACQKAEHDFANMPCGIMDQFAAVFSKKEAILLLDCESMDIKHIDYNNDDLVVLVTDSNVKHKLSGSEYPTRRKQCFEAAQLMKIQTLRNADMDMLKENKSKMDPTVYRRARHVISEIQRTLDAVQDLLTNDIKALGYHMLQSHYSLKYDFEVSCDELDSLVDIAMKTKGVYGSRMTGGGFGGCTVTLLDRSAVDDLIAKTKEQYRGNPRFYIATPSEGAANDTETIFSISSELTWPL